MKYRVKLSYPTILFIDGKEYQLFPEQEVELPESEIVQTYIALNYLEPAETKKTKNKEVSDAS